MLSRLLTLLEVISIGAVVAGVGLWLGVAAALILGGLIGVGVCELVEHRRHAAAAPRTAAGGAT